MIWIVSEHTQTRQPLAALIESKGYPVLEIECGDDVVRRLQFAQPTLVILDCGAGDSFQTLRSIRQSVRTIKLPVIMFTSSDEDFKHRAMTEGASAYVKKGALDWADMLDEIVRFAGKPGER